MIAIEKSMPSLLLLDEEFSGTSDRAAAIMAAAVLEETLLQLLELAFIPKPRGINPFAPGRELASFASRIRLAQLLGLIECAEYRRLVLITKICGYFARLDLQVSLASPEIARRCEELFNTGEVLPAVEMRAILGIQDLPSFAGLHAVASEPRALFEQSVLSLLYGLNRRIALARSGTEDEPERGKLPVGLMGQALAYSLVARREAISSGFSEAYVEELSKIVERVAVVALDPASGMTLRTKKSFCGTSPSLLEDNC